MRTSKVQFLKLLAVLTMIASLSGMLSLTANAGVASFVTGRVVDADGNPLEGVTVCLETPDYCTSTGWDGYYQIDYVDEGWHWVSASLDGYQSQSQSIMVGIGVTVEANFTLTPAEEAGTGTVSGTVTAAADGSPLEGATVCVGTACTATDAAGTYAIADVLTGTRSVGASIAGYGASTQEVKVPAGDAVTADFALVTLGLVSGTVTDSVTGEPLAGGVCAYPGLCVPTDAAGAYSIAALPDGEYGVTAHVDGYQSQSQPITISAGDVVEVNFAMTLAPDQEEGTGTVSGTVTDSVTGDPLVGARVCGGGCATTDAAGAYAITDVPAGKQYVSASIAGYEGSGQEVTIPTGGTATVDLALDPISSLRGTVTDSVTGEILVGARVCLDRSTQCAVVWSADNGYGFSGSTILWGDHNLTAIFDGYVRATHHITVTPGAYMEVNFALDPISSLHGTVTDGSTGAALEGATVCALKLCDITDAAGAYAIAAVPAGPQSVTATIAGYEDGTAAVTVPVGGNVETNFALEQTPAPTGPGEPAPDVVAVLVALLIQILTEIFGTQT